MYKQCMLWVLCVWSICVAPVHAARSTVTIKNSTSGAISVTLWFLLEVKEFKLERITTFDSEGRRKDITQLPEQPGAYGVQLYSSNDASLSGIVAGNTVSITYTPVRDKATTHPITGETVFCKKGGSYYDLKDRLIAVQIDIDGTNKKIEYALSSEAADRSPIAFMASDTMSELSTRKTEFENATSQGLFIEVQEDGDNNDEPYSTQMNGITILDKEVLRAIIYRDAGGTTNLVWKSGAGLPDSRKLPPYSEV